MNELGAAEGFIQAQLTGDATLMAAVSGVFNGAAPRGTLPPFVVYNWQSNTDVKIVGSIRIAIEPMYLVRVVHQTGTPIDLRALADRVDAVLDRTSGSFGGHRIASCVREDVYTMVDNSEEVPWRFLGGYYRLYVQ